MSDSTFVWTFFPDLNEQRSLEHMPAGKLFPSLVRSANPKIGVLPQAVYDLYFLGQLEKAAELIKKAQELVAAKEINFRFTLIVVLSTLFYSRTKEELESFVAFCKQHNVEIDINF